MRNRVLVAASVVLIASLAGHPAGATSAAWSGEPTLIAGTARYDTGEWIYTDYVYDDYGADTTPAGQPNVVSLASTAGDFRYPDGPSYADNTADIVFVRARLAGTDDLQIQVELQTLTDPSVIALDVSVNGTAVIITEGNADIDAAANTVTFTVPGAAAGDMVDLFVGAGLHDGNGGLRAGTPGSAYQYPGEFTTGGPTDARLFDLAFNADHIEGRGGAWNENEQSAALAAGTVDARFHQTVTVASLRDGVTEPVEIPHGYSVHLFRSAQDLGEGVAGSFPQYRSAWQPYALWVPASYEPGEPSPFWLMMHSLSVHHNQYRGAAATSSYRTFYEQAEDGLDAIVATPLARGPDGWYEDEGLVDTLEVWADVASRYDVDRERVYVGGYSMGGYGTYRLATMMPDVFASATSIVGPPGNGIWAYPLDPPGGPDSPDFTYPQLESMLHVPIWITHGVEDELVPFTGVTMQAQRFAALGHEYRFALHPVADHLGFVFMDEWSREIAWLASHPTRVTNPARITLDVRPASWATGGDPVIVGHLETLTAEIGARLDGAYWIDDVTVAGGGDVTGEIDLTSGAIAHQQIGTALRAGAGADHPSPYVLTGQDKEWHDIPTNDVVTGSVSGVTTFTIDVGRAGLSDTPVLAFDTDRQVTVTLVRDGDVVGTAIVA